MNTRIEKVFSCILAFVNMMNFALKVNRVKNISKALLLNRMLLHFYDQED